MYKLAACLLVAALTLTQQLNAQLPCPIDIDTNVPRSIQTMLYRGEQNFTIAMLSAIQSATPNENIFFSPYSTYHALLLAYFGSRGHTEQELIKGLHLGWATNRNHVSHAYKVEKNSRIIRAAQMPLEFESADKIYFSEDIELDGCSFDLFEDELESMDFRNKADESRMRINGWIANITRNEIPEMLNPGDVSAETQMVLANAAYFKGQWANQFDPKETMQKIFYTNSTKQSFVPMMQKRGTYSLTIDERLGAHILEMPYQTSREEGKESDISMVIVLPPFTDNGLENVLTKLTPDTLDAALKDGMLREIDISLPKFKFEQNLELVPILRKLGINSIFNHDADMSGYTKSQLMFGDAKHVAKIKVDEEGSTAAAATVLFSFRSARPVEPTKFECNHPFLFLIYDHVTKAVLFTGIYRDPMTAK